MREESFRKFFHLMITWGSCLSILLVNKSGKFLVLCKIYILKKRNSLIAKNKHIPSSCLKQIIDKLPHNFPDSFFFVSPCFQISSMYWKYITIHGVDDIAYLYDESTRNDYCLHKLCYKCPIFFSLLINKMLTVIFVMLHNLFSLSINA